jgi:hypothetical protein
MELTDSDYEFEGDESDDDDYGEPIGSCDECSTNLYEDNCYEIDGLEVCGHCYWWMTH